MAEKPVEASSCNISGSFSQDAAISHLTVGIDSLDGVSIDVTHKDPSREHGNFASSKGNNYLNGSEDDDGNAPQICKTGKTIGEYVPNETDYSLEMTYDDMYRVTGKSQHLSQSGVQFEGTLSSGYELTYTYGQDTGKRFQMSTVNDVNYRTDSVYSSADDMAETHYYEYDKNGNIIHALTSETRADGTTVNQTREERFRWDEENRLLAISQNGYVSHYWYDADGERVVKEHGANQAVFVNSDQNTVLTQTNKFTVYPNPYFSYSDDGRYTKHIYIGAERIASQVGGKPYPSPNTESVSVAGRSNGIDIRVDYSGKLDQHLAQIDSVYDAFDLPYNGTNHDSYYDNYFFDRPGYWDNTEGMTLNGGEPETPRGIQDRDLLYYYHRDHLGSSTAVSNDDGKLSQQIEYLPYGEVFLEKQMASGDYHSPFRFNGKELDEETGLYYYGARYMNPRLSIWYGTDPMQEKYPDISSYCYTFNNPITHIDPNGKDAILIVFPDYPINFYNTPEFTIPLIGRKIKSYKINVDVVGHAGILLINNKTGLTKYYEYGRYDTEDGTKGRVRSFSVPNVNIDNSGQPTNESLNNVLRFISRKAGKNGRIDGAYIKSDSFDEMNEYAKSKMNESNFGNPNYKKERKPYNLINNNCGTFTVDVIKQDPSVDIPWIVNTTPNNIVSEFQEEGNARVLYSPDTNSTTIGVGNETDAKKY